MALPARSLKMQKMFITPGLRFCAEVAITTPFWDMGVAQGPKRAPRVMGWALMGMLVEAERPVMSLVRLNVNITALAWRVVRRGDARAVERRVKVDVMVEAFIFACGLGCWAFVGVVWCGWFLWSECRKEIVEIDERR